MLVCLVLTLTTSPQAAQDTGAKYYPIKVGNTWTYTFRLGDQSFPMVSKIAGEDNSGDLKLYRLEGETNGQQSAVEHLQVTDKGVFRHKYNNVDVDPPFQVLRFPMKDGDSWSMDNTIAGQSLSSKIKVSKEDVTVPAGKYKAFKVTVDTDVGGQKLHSTQWFAPDVGLVKQSVTLPDGRMGTMELDKFKLAK
jgi:hypothetical protein